jgi:hypothetical protein
MKLTYKELCLFRGVLRARRMYRGMKLPLSAVVWEDWMEESLEKIEEELYRVNPNTPDWK